MCNFGENKYKYINIIQKCTYLESVNSESGCEVIQYMNSCYLRFNEFDGITIFFFSKFIMSKNNVNMCHINMYVCKIGVQDGQAEAMCIYRNLICV